MLWGIISFRLSISFRFFYFPRRDNSLLCNVTTKEFQQKDISSIQTEVPAQMEGEKDLFLPAGRGLSGRDSNSAGKGQCFTVRKGKAKNNTKKATEESSGIRCSLYLCNREAKTTAPSPKRLSVHNRFLLKGLLYTQLPNWCSHRLLACFIAFELPEALIGEVHQMWWQRIFAGRILGSC